MHNSSLKSAEITFLSQIRKELSMKSYQDVIKRVVSVLKAFRQTLSPQSANTLSNSLPDFLKTAFTHLNTKGNQRQKTIEHLDELVTLVMKQDRKHKNFIFENEVQTLSIVILTLKKLLKLRGLENFDGISHTLRHELDEIPIESATV